MTGNYNRQIIEFYDPIELGLIIKLALPIMAIFSLVPGL